MDPDAPQTPDLDLDLPGQPQDRADLDIEVAPEPGGTGGSEDADGVDAAPDDPEAGNTLIRPDNA